MGISAQRTHPLTPSNVGKVLQNLGQVASVEPLAELAGAGFGRNYG